ncbi:hypothetical protein B9Z55_023941 [Caenorhabditis nigoni]|uniref:F-box domain-containing protein n=1 Tax=Caenorhabditis nigoni TaxID=1611254 RepID=A0A2G5SSA1_9PELO|nr:hypothetical protein B9Z55_023941 [Caenorhabditis nigoni]
MSSLSENPPRKGIRFLTFPWDLKQEILKQCDRSDLLKLSLASKRCKQIVGSSRFPVIIDITMDQEFKIVVSDSRKPTSSFTWLLGNYVTVKRNPHFLFENLFPTQMDSSFNKSLGQCETAQFRTHCSRRGTACLRAALSHLSKIFPNFQVRDLFVNAKLWDSSIFGAMDMKKIMECVYEAECLKIEAGMIDREMINLMEKVKCIDNFDCYAENTMGYILNRKLECSFWISVDNCQWFDPERFEDLCCESMILTKTRVKTGHVEDLIIKWRNSNEELGEGVKNIKFFEVEIQGGVRNFDFSRVGAQPKGTVQRPNKFTLFGVTYDFSNAFDIIHQDGTLASLSVVEVFDRVLFVVWSR